MNVDAFFSELTAVALHGAVFSSLGLALWLLCGRQSAARSSACGRLIIVATLVVMFVGFGVAWQRCRTPAEVVPATPAVTTVVPLPEAASGGESLSILTPLPDDSAMIPAPRETDSSNAPDTAVQWQLRPAMAALLVILWAAGAVAIALRRAIALLLRRRFVREAVVVEDQSWQNLLASLACGMRPVCLLRHGGGAIPCAWGIFRPVILLPQDADRWPGSQRRMVLAHECAHLRRRDPLWQAAGEVFLAFQWFNPFAWLILRRCRMADERAADDSVLQTETDAPAYAELLVTCARKWSTNRGLATVTSGMAGPSTVCRRVECVLDSSADRRPAGVFVATLWSALCTLLAASVILLSPRMTVAQEPDHKPATSPLTPPWPADREPQTLEELHAALDTLILSELKFDATPLSVVIRSLYERTKVNFIVRRDDDKKITLELRATSLRGAIEAVCKASGMDYEIQQRPVIIVRVPQGEQMLTRTYRIPDSFPGSLPNKDLNATAMLKAAGIETPEGALASFDAESRRLVVKNTPEQHRRTYQFIHSGKTDGAFPWHPVRISDVEYISAGDVELFYGCLRFPDGGPVLKPDGTLTFGNRRFAMTWKKDDTAISINNERLNLSHPVIEHEKSLCISWDDFSTIVEPKLRQSAVQAPAASSPPAPAPAPVPTKPEPEPQQLEFGEIPAKKAHSWNPVTLAGLEYIAAGEVARFYGFPQQKTDSDGNLWLRSPTLVVRWRKDSNEILINNVRFLLKHPVIEHDGSLWISRYDLTGLFHPVLRPAHIKHPPQVSTVVIDAGHGGLDAGAINRHGKESDFTLDTAKRLKRKLEALGYRVVMTRSDDRFLSRPDRVAIANAEVNAILISLHYNSFTADRSGTQTFFPGEAMADRSASADERDAWIAASVALATAVHANVLYKLRAIDGGLKSNEVLDGIRLPMAMIEGGFLSNAEEGARIATPEYRERLADAVAGGVQNFVKAVRRNGRINRSAPVPPLPK